MVIDRDTVKYVANLARMELSESELEGFTSQLDRILEYVDKLKTLDVTRIEPVSHVLDIKNVYREDRVKPSLSVAEVIKNAPDKQGNMFKVQRII